MFRPIGLGLTIGSTQDGSLCPKCKEFRYHCKCHKETGGRLMKAKKWARVGMTIEVDMELWEQDQKKAVMDAFSKGNVELDGETYFPEEADVNDGTENDVYLSGNVILVAED